jgi:tRNA(His) 5'-end guanylyltransferase
MRLWKKLGLPKPKSEASTGELSLVDNEVYSGIEVPEMPFFVRLDGWAFHGLAKQLKLKKPFDRFFISCLARTAAKFFIPFNPALSYIFSDEINFLFLKNPIFRRIEKIDSVFAGFASSNFLIEINKKYKQVKAVSFDCRCIPLEKRDILKYLVWRQAEAFRNHNNAWAQYVLMKKSLSARSASRKLAGLKVKDLMKLCKENKIDLDKTPAWQRRGVLLYKEKYKKKGYDPVKKKSVIVTRFRVKENWEMPAFNSKEGKGFLDKLFK